MRERFTVCEVSSLGPDIHRMVIDAPRVAQYARPGQFVIVRPTSDGERIPLTVCEADPASGTITLVVQGVGRSTNDMLSLHERDHLADVLGPLGLPTEVERFGTCAIVAGGVGVAIALPVARAWKAAGNEVIGVLGARSASHLILVEELAATCDDVHLTTEDGSAGSRGLVTDALASVLHDREIARVFVVGPIAMMRAVADLTQRADVPTVASLNPLMVDGTGMCGGCRVTIGGETRFACVDGPEFDAHLVDFDALAMRNTAYRTFEACQRDLVETPPRPEPVA
jgi:ferredoxin/flavodoxin---NADP+ reductase